MPTRRRSSAPSTAAPRRRRTAEEARTAILDAAERRLVASGPASIRLQEVAADVGVSHPTVLHHFGSREALVEAVVVRALDSLHARLLEAVRASPEGPHEVTALLRDAARAGIAEARGVTPVVIDLSGRRAVTSLLADADGAIRHGSYRR